MLMLAPFFAAASPPPFRPPLRCCFSFLLMPRYVFDATPPLPPPYFDCAPRRCSRHGYAADIAIIFFSSDAAIFRPLRLPPPRFFHFRRRFSLVAIIAAIFDAVSSAHFSYYFLFMPSLIFTI
jgi:hypothetical protein